MRRILVVNDDGIGAEGIVRLAAAAKNLGEVWVVAPGTDMEAVLERYISIGKIRNTVLGAKGRTDEPENALF